MWEVTLTILLIPRPSVHTLGFIHCIYTVRGLFGSKFHKCKFVNFSVISYIPHVVWPTPDLPTHGKFWSPLPVARFTAYTRTATQLCWAISCYPFSPCYYCVPARHPQSPVGSRRTYKTWSMPACSQPHTGKTRRWWHHGVGSTHTTRQSLLADSPADSIMIYPHQRHCRCRLPETSLHIKRPGT